MKTYKYIVKYRGPYGQHITHYIARDAEELAILFFADHKHVDYSIIKKEAAHEVN